MAEPPVDRITVAVLTRRRPRMLAALLDSWAAMTPPERCTVGFLVVENDDAPHARDLVEARHPLPAGSLRYVLETEPGIPFGRNRAAREAIADGSGLLAFVDDDEVVASDWLARIVAAQRVSGAVLLGGPVGIRPVVGELPWAQRRMHASLDRHLARKAARAASLAGLHGTPGVTVVTNNWLGRTTIFSRTGIWFDETMRFTGGTDAKLYREVVDAGLPTAWVSDAYVYADVPPERLTFGYQFARARDQSNTLFRSKVEAGASNRASVLVTVPLKVASAVLLALAVPVTNGATIMNLARTVGWIAGRFNMLMGFRSQHYKTQTGR